LKRSVGATALCTYSSRLRNEGRAFYNAVSSEGASYPRLAVLSTVAALHCLCQKNPYKDFGQTPLFIISSFSHTRIMRHWSASTHRNRSDAMAKYGKKAQEKVEKAMHERKRGTLRSGSGKKVTSRKQALAIGLSEARKSGAKVPARSSSSR